MLTSLESIPTNDAAISCVVIASIVVLLVLSLGELDSAGPGADDDADVLTFGWCQRFEFQPRIFGGFIGREERHGNRALHTVFIFL
jgi:hypothetical protein